MGEVWKERLNQMTKEEFTRYRKEAIIEVDRSAAKHARKEGNVTGGHPVSRGTAKLRWLVERRFLEPVGKVIDLGCGRGGWCYYMATQKESKKSEGTQRAVPDMKSPN